MLLLMWLGCHGGPNETNPMMLIPWIDRCRESEVALLTSQEGIGGQAVVETP